MLDWKENRGEEFLQYVSTYVHQTLLIPFKDSSQKGEGDVTKPTYSYVRGMVPTIILLIIMDFQDFWAQRQASALPPTLSV